MEISGGRSEFDIDDEHDSARTIAASFFTLFIFFFSLFVLCSNPMLELLRMSFHRLHLLIKHSHKAHGYGILPCAGSCRGRAEMSRNEPPWAALKGHLKQWTQTASTYRKLDGVLPDKNGRTTRLKLIESND